MIQLQINSINGLELKEPTTIYGWCTYENKEEEMVFVQVYWNWTKEKAKLNKSLKHEPVLVEEVRRLINSGQVKAEDGKELSPNQFFVNVANIKGSGFEECKKSIDKEVQEVIELQTGRTKVKLKK